MGGRNFVVSALIKADYEEDNVDEMKEKVNVCSERLKFVLVERFEL